jgi:DNA repair exonuclease SbcCD ATPase subunit
MKIIALEAENIKNLKVVHIEPDGSVVVIGGENEQGKTSVLDSIMYALSGANAIPSKPIRDGQQKARVTLDLGVIEVIRTFTDKGTRLTVKNKDGATFASPQAMLDKLVGELTFDPLEFSKMDAKQQAEVLKKLVGLDFDKMNAKYKGLFDERATVNRKGKELKHQLDGMTQHDGLPDEEVSLKELAAQYTEALEHNGKIESAKRELASELSELLRLKKRFEKLNQSVKQKQKLLKEMRVIDAPAIHATIAELESTNTKISQNQSYKIAEQKLVQLREQSGSLSKQMEAITTKKKEALTKTKFPIKGLAIDEDGVTFEGIPFDQCSTAQKIRISVAIGLAMNPKLRILLIREGSLLDSKNLAMVAKMSEDADAQIWLERVSKGKECQVIIEDGSIMEPEMANA